MAVGSRGLAAQRVSLCQSPVGRWTERGDSSLCTRTVCARTGPSPQHRQGSQEQGESKTGSETVALGWFPDAIKAQGTDPDSDLVCWSEGSTPSTVRACSVLSTVRSDPPALRVAPEYQPRENNKKKDLAEAFLGCPWRLSPPFQQGRFRR